MSFNYAEQFTDFLAQKYSKELTSYDLQTSNPQVQFINAKTIKLPRLTLSGYKDHTRGSAYNAGTLTNDWEPKVLAHDRDIEYIIDPMDIDETNLAVSVANIQKVFEEEHAIPEKDSYRYSKLYSELNTYKSANIVSGTPTANNILSLFDTAMENMDNAGVPSEGRILYVTPFINKLLKTADGISRQISVQGGSSAINRTVHNIDDVKIQVVPAGRMKTFLYTHQPLYAVTSMRTLSSLHLVRIAVPLTITSTRTAVMATCSSCRGKPTVCKFIRRLDYESSKRKQSLHSHK